MRSALLTGCVLLFLTVARIQSAKILGVFNFPAYSHYALGDRLVKALAEKGHEVTVISPFEEKKPIQNFKQILVTELVEKMEANRKGLFNPPSSALWNTLWLDMMGLYVVDATLQHPNVQKLIKSNEKFDLVIMEQFLNEAFSGFCHRFNAPCIVLGTFGPSRMANPRVGNPSPPSYIPDFSLSYSNNMNFFERVHNSLVVVANQILFNLHTLPKHNEILHKYFPDAPHIEDLYYNVSLVLLNSHPSTNAPVPLVPNMIEIGGYHVKPAKELPHDLKKYLDDAKDGAILFSMGSNLKSKEMPPEKRDAILRSFSKLKQKVLWKWEDESLPGQPSNVKLGKWLPQQDILAHPNIKLFITHGGLLSTIETIYHGVPVIGIPVFGDQDLNVANAQTAGYAIKVPYKDLNEENLSAALSEILNNPKYSENAKRRSRVMHDDPVKPLEKATFWVEYVLRHKGAYHLRTAALNLTWYQYLLLDVAAAFVTISLLGAAVSCVLLRKICCRKNDNKKPVSKNKKKN